MFAVVDLIWYVLISLAVIGIVVWAVYTARLAVIESARVSKEFMAYLEAAQVRSSAKLDAIARTGEKTHTLVNSNMAVQLQLNATVTRRLADLTKAPVDIEAARLAERLHREHEGKQNLVDLKEAEDIKDAGESSLREAVRQEVRDVGGREDRREPAQ